MLQMAEVPCLHLAEMTPAEKRAYVLADNKLAQNSGWDEEYLSLELQAILDDADIIDIEITGFSIAEIDEIIDVGGTNVEADATQDDCLPEQAVDSPAISQFNDLWYLGEHRLICGDARDPEIYQRLMQSSRGASDVAQMVFTDPPYNVPVNGHVMGSGKVKHREFAMATGEMSSSAFATFLQCVFGQLVEQSANGSIHFICMDWRHMNEIMSAGDAAYTELKNLIVWVKDNGGMGSFYRSRHELVFVFKNGSGPHINSFELGQHGRYRTNVWNYRGINSGTKIAREELELHPTVKPVAMVADAMLDCSARGGIVLDAFCGSGTTLIAAQKTGRRARAIELDALYCDTAIERWQLFAKDDAVLAQTGETYAQVMTRRAIEELRPDQAIGGSSVPNDVRNDPSQSDAGLHDHPVAASFSDRTFTSWLPQATMSKSEIA